jgi:sugar/nucleoside kinase (ribokinase family)
VLVDAHPPARITSARVSGTSPEQRPGPPPGAPTLCLGEALVDLICERPITDIAHADFFVPHFGGAVANVAVTAARNGARMALAGGAGEDAWGRWLTDRLRREGVDVSLFELVAGSPTPLAVVRVNPAGEATYYIYGQMIATVVHAIGRRVEEVVRRSAGLFISSNTLVGEEEREVTMQARQVALELERPVVFDPNLRLHRWRSRAEAAATACACVPGALLVRANAPEAEAMTGEKDPERAALALLKAGARMVVITLGPKGAMLRGELRVDVPGEPAAVLSTIGAGDVLTGILLARLASSAFYPAAAAASLPEAVVQSARACERWGALE